MAGPIKEFRNWQKAAREEIRTAKAALVDNPNSQPLRDNLVIANQHLAEAVQAEADYRAAEAQAHVALPIVVIADLQPAQPDDPAPDPAILIAQVPPPVQPVQAAPDVIIQQQVPDNQAPPPPNEGGNMGGRILGIGLAIVLLFVFAVGAIWFLNQKPALLSNSSGTTSAAHVYKVGDAFPYPNGQQRVMVVDSNGNVSQLSDTSQANTSNDNSDNNAALAQNGSNQASTGSTPEPEPSMASSDGDNQLPSADCANPFYCLWPNQQNRHPSLYVETGVPDILTNTSKNTKTWNIHVESGTTAIVGGFAVDGVSDGVYKAIAGPTDLRTTVSDGFLLIIQDSWGNEEFCFRIGEAIEFDWAHQHEQPLTNWETCGF